MIRLQKRGNSEIPVSVLAELAPYGRLMTGMLYRRGIGTCADAERFLHPSLQQQHSPFLFPDMEKAACILRTARENGLRVCVYGDYDADGVCATALLYSALEQYGIRAGRYTPERCEGYGLNEAAVRKIAESYQVLVTVDLGITNHAEVALARQLGLRVIVTDHHMPDNAPCQADAVLDPRLPGYPFGGLCGTGVAFKLVQALGFSEEEYLQWIDLVAVATVSDIVPLRDENRVYVSLGLERLRHSPCMGLRELLKVCRTAQVNADTLGFQLGPRLNAAGRVGSPSIAVELLLSREEQGAKRNAAILNELNEQRQTSQQRIVEAALEKAKAHDFTDEPMLMLWGDNWEKGLVGLAAGALNQQYGCPTAVFSRDPQTDMLTGSFRGVQATDIAACLLSAKDLTVRSGGHKMAGGATVTMANYERFRERMEGEIRKLPMKDLLPVQEYENELDFRDLNLSLVDALRSLEPFGCENPAPVFLVRGALPVKYRAVGRDMTHLKIDLRRDGVTREGIAFGYGALAADMPDSLDALYSVERNEYNGRESVQLKISGLWPHEGDLLGKARRCPPDERVLLGMLGDLYHWKERADTEAFSDRIRRETENGAADELRQAVSRWERGHLLVTRSPENAARWAEILGEEHLQLSIGESKQPMCLTTLLLYPYADAAKNVYPEEEKLWHHIWLLDGECVPREACGWAARHPRAVVHILPLPDGERSTLQGVILGSQDWNETIRSVHVSEDGGREIVEGEN